MFENRGTVELASGTLQLGRLGAYNQFSGSTRLTGGGVQSSGQLMELMGGSLVGTGTIATNVQNLDSTVAPGRHARVHRHPQVAGDYTHPGSGSVLEVDLKGTNPGRQFDQLQVTGKALVNWGPLDLDAASTFAPGTSTKLKVLTAGQVTGSGFTRLQDPGLPNGREWCATYILRDVTLGVRQA